MPVMPRLKLLTDEGWTRALWDDGELEEPLVIYNGEEYENALIKALKYAGVEVSHESTDFENCEHIFDKDGGIKSVDAEKGDYTVTVVLLDLNALPNKQREYVRSFRAKKRAMLYVDKIKTLKPEEMYYEVGTRGSIVSVRITQSIDV